MRAWLRRALAEVVTSAPADISRLASYTVRPSPDGDNGLSARRSKHTANGAEPQFHVLVVKPVHHELRGRDDVALGAGWLCAGSIFGFAAP